MPAPRRDRPRTLLPALSALLPLLATCAGPVGSLPTKPGAALTEGREYAFDRELLRCLEHECRTKGIGAISLAVVEDGEVTWAMGHGLLEPDSEPERALDTDAVARADTLYRVGSVTKLFTDVALMRLVEEGRVDLDAPVRTYLSDFAPWNPFGGEITLRQLAAHRAGLVREPPVGSYFDPDEPSLAETVASLNRTALVAAPGTLTKYSNAGLAVIGRTIEVVHGRPFADVLRAEVLAPLGLDEASIAHEPWMDGRLARGRMWTYDGRVFDAPAFELGMAPAGNLYASMLDLARFASVACGAAEPEAHVLERETWERMMEPARDPEGRPTGFGIGFAIGALDGRRRCGHGGAIYGHATELAFLPDERIGVAVACSMDVSNAVTRRVADHVLRAVLAAREGRPIPTLELSEPLSEGLAARLAGHYRSAEGARAAVVRRGARAFLEWGGMRRELRQLGGAAVVDDRHAYGTPVAPAADGVAIAGRPYARVPDPRPAPCPERWRELVGEYGWDHNVLVVREEAGALEALIEWFWFDRLTELEHDVFALPEQGGLYSRERLTFVRDEAGAVSGARLGAVLFPRRPHAPPGGFRIEPVAPIEELRRAALAAAPPAPGRGPGQGAEPTATSDLVDLTRMVEGLTLDVRYATDDNFLGTAVYPAARAFLQRPAAEALARVQARLAGHGLGLAVFDAYRPWHVTRIFWDATPEGMKHFVADPERGSRHNRGCAVDLTLVDLGTGEQVAMTSGYDEFTARAYPDYPGGTSRERWHREALRAAMEAEGFAVYEWEWWHFDHGGWEAYGIEDRSFAELTAGG